MSYAAVKPRLAIASNYDDSSCGIAAYTRVREEALAQFFDVTVFDLRSARLMRPAGRRREAALRIDEICGQLPKFDVTVLDSEFGIWGVGAATVGRDEESAVTSPANCFSNASARSNVSNSSSSAPPHMPNCESRTVTSNLGS